MSERKKTLQNPDLAELLSELSRNIMINLNCHAVGIIQEFSTTDQTAKVKIAYKQKFSEKNPITGVFEKKLRDYPILLDVPCLFPRGGSGSLRMPVEQGDECLILFNDRSIDDWIQTGQVGEVESLRLHSMADAIAFVGIGSNINALQNFSGDRTELVHDSTMVSLKDKLKLENGSQNLYTILNNLVTELDTLTQQLSALTVGGVATGSGTSGPPSNAAQFTTINANLQTIATNLGELLE